MTLIIEEKLKLNQTPICFFKEGIFLKVLNESFYVVQQHFKLNLKPQVKYIKKINQTVIIGGFPFKAIIKKFPDAKPTEFGYQLLGDYDLSGYNDWYTHCCRRYQPKAKTDVATQMADNSNAQTVSEVINQTEIIPKQHQKQQKTVTEQQLAFLQLWQPNLYSQAIDTAFIKELKEYLLS